MEEQCIPEEDGSLRTKKDGGTDASILQNPADPDVIYREKTKKQNRGYVANVAEASGDEYSIVTDYQYEKNTPTANFKRTSWQRKKHMMNRLQ